MYDTASAGRARLRKRLPYAIIKGKESEAT